MSDLQYVGKRIPKLDALDKATGKARYIQDLILPGMLCGKILRSKMPSARILKLDTARAQNLAGVKTVLTFKDTPGVTFGFANDRLPIQKDTVRCFGDEIAAVAAVDEDTANEALGLIDVQYEALPGVFDAGQALASKVLVHPERESNLFKEYTYSHGDVDSSFAGCAIAVEGSFALPYQAHCCLSPSGVAAEWDARGKLTLYTPTQVPFLIQRDVAKALGISPADVRIVQPVIGGGFGSRLDLYPYEIIGALLARSSDRPVKILFDREEEFVMDPFRPKTFVTMKLGADKQGRLVACDSSVIVDCGAYISWGAVTPIVMMHTVGCVYNMEAVRFNAKAVYTNNPHTGAFRGFGNPEIVFALETLVDQLAEQLKMDPAEFRLMNANVAGQVTPQGSRITSCGFEECLQEATSRIAWGKKDFSGNSSLKRGKGLAAVFHVGGGARIYKSDGCGAMVHLDDYGRATVVTGATDIGQGSETVIAQIVAEVLSIPIDAITVLNSDSQTRPWDVGVHASRTTFIAGNAAKLAAAEARKQLLEAASKMFQCSTDQLDVRNGNVFLKDDPDKSVAYDRILRGEHFKQGGNIVIGKAFYDPPTQMVDENNKGNISAAYTFGVQAVDVEVDVETGQVRVLKVVAAHDVGKAINPMYVEGQIEGGVLSGIGYALMEEAQVKEGRLLNPTFLDYRLPGMCDMPEIESVIIESIDPEGPFGAKGIGEPPLIPTAPAIANAIYDAIGIRLRELPMTPERVLAAIQNSRRNE
jgi:xanthine dehydrogenase molybdenum-binding subunit